MAVLEDICIIQADFDKMPLELIDFWAFYAWINVRFLIAVIDFMIYSRNISLEWRKCAKLLRTTDCVKNSETFATIFTSICRVVGQSHAVEENSEDFI